MKHTSPTAIKWRTPWKCSKAKINLSPEKLQHLDRRKAMIQKAVVHFTAKAPSILSLLKLNFFFITFSPHLLPFSILLLYMVFLLWWYIPSSCYFWLLLYSMSSVHVSHSFSLFVKFCMVSSVMDSLLCPTDMLPLQEMVGLLLLFLFPHMHFLKQAVTSKVNKSILHPCKSHHKPLQFYKQVTEFDLQRDWHFLLFGLCMFILRVGRGSFVILQWFSSMYVNA